MALLLDLGGPAYFEVESIRLYLAHKQQGLNSLLSSLDLQLAYAIVRRPKGSLRVHSKQVFRIIRVFANQES